MGIGTGQHKLTVGVSLPKFVESPGLETRCFGDRQENTSMLDGYTRLQ